jgi:hypothetical protein
MKRLLACTLLIVAAIVTLVSCFNNGRNEETLPKNVSYNFHIRPVLSDKCFKCHGPDPSHREAGLRLDIADSAYAPLRKRSVCDCSGKARAFGIDNADFL